MKKVYTVILSDESKCDEIHNLICSTTENISNIPNENIQCVDRKSHSKLRTSYRLTDSQVNILKNNPDILSVELDHGYYNDDNLSIRSTASFKYSNKTYSFRPQNKTFNRRRHTNVDKGDGTTGIFHVYDFPWEDHTDTTAIGSPSPVRQPYTKITENIKYSFDENDASYHSDAYLEPVNIETEDANVVSWGKIRTKYKYNPWAGISSCFIIDDNISDVRSGEDVDLVVMDEGVDKLHPEFLDDNGVSRVRDIVVDGPGYVDPNYFSSNPTKTYMDWWENSSNRSAAFQSLGTVVVPRYTVLIFAMQSYSDVSLFEDNIGNKVIQTVDGSEYTRGTIKEVIDLLADYYFAVKVQLDLGKPHFRYHAWSNYGSPINSQPEPPNGPCYLTVDPDGDPTFNAPPNQAAGFVYDTQSVLVSNPNNTPVDSTGTFDLATTMDIRETSNQFKVNITSGSPVVEIESTSNSSLLDDITEYSLHYVKPISGVIGTGTTILSVDSSANTFTMSSNALATRSNMGFRISNNFKGQANNWGDASNIDRDYGWQRGSYWEYDWDYSTNPTSWLGYTLEYKNGLDNRTHGTHCASEAAGKNFGYASKCNIWSITLPVSGGNFTDGKMNIGLGDAFDCVKIFHQAKSNNPKYGDKDPTVVNGSFGSYAAPYMSIPDDDTCSYTYRGSSGTYSFKRYLADTGSTPDFIKQQLYKTEYRCGNKMYNSNHIITEETNLRYSYIPSTNTAYKTAGEECLNAGVHMCFAAGNDNAYVIKDSTDQDYNNSFTNPIGNYTCYLHRVGSPSDISGSINVGALSCTTRADGKERRDYYSQKGPGVDIYAPALNTISANSYVKMVYNPTTLGQSNYKKSPYRIRPHEYFPDSEKDINYKSFSGTSCASPQVAGVLATFLEKNRTATTAQAKEWLLGTSSSYSTAGSYIDTNIVNESYTGFWPDPSVFSTSVSSYDEQTYSVGDESIVLDANHHVAYSESADALLDTNIKILYNPYNDLIAYDSDYGILSGKGMSLTGITIEYT